MSPFPLVRRGLVGGAAGIRTPGLLIAKACPVPRSPVYALHELPADRQSAPSSVPGGHRGGTPIVPWWASVVTEEVRRSTPWVPLEAAFRASRAVPDDHAEPSRTGTT